MNNRFVNGGKPSWLTYLTAGSLVLIIIINFPRITDRIFNKGAASALMAQSVEYRRHDHYRENTTD